jgi:hypothetical protein
VDERLAVVNLLYIIGEPGVGKSALAAELVRGRRRRVRQQPFVHTEYEGGLVQLGRERSGRSGTDALSMSVSPLALRVLEAGIWRQVLGEGDRLAHVGFFEGARKAGYAVEVVLLSAPPEVAAERREKRGSEQDGSWLAGRLTKVRNLAEHATMTLDATRPVAELAAELADHPALAPVTREDTE